MAEWSKVLIFKCLDDSDSELVKLNLQLKLGFGLPPFVVHISCNESPSLYGPTSSLSTLPSIVVICGVSGGTVFAKWFIE